MNGKRNQARDVGFYFLVLVLLISTIYMMTTEKEETTALSYSEIVDLFKEEKVESFVVDGTELTIELKEELNGSKNVSHDLLSVTFFREDLNELVEEQYEEGIISEYSYDRPADTSWWLMPMVEMLLIFGVLALFWVFMARMAKKNGGGAGGAMKFGKSKAKVVTDEKMKKTFADVAGAEEEKEELEEIVSFLKRPIHYTEMGARIPKGVLLVGPPGTGKTLLAKAVAGEAGVQFMSISGSDFVELYVGVGASRVRDLFAEAKKIAPAIVFIDEIDAVGRQRGSGLGGGHDEREQTLNQLLVEMDGFSNNDGVIVMAATNRADILDNALLRPGRFDRTVYVGLPDIKGREAILKVHARGKQLGDNCDLNSIARGTPGFSGADLENLMNEAAILTVRRGKRFIEQTEIEESILKVIAGPEKKSKIMSDKAKRLTAYHEAGHAIAGKFMEGTDPVQYITIIPRGPSGGMTVYRPSEDKENYRSKGEMFADIVVSLGGRIAEKLMLDDISTGASGDIQSASATARAMVTRYGFSEKLGPISFDSSDHSIFIGRDFGQTKSYSEETASLIDEEVKRIFDEAGKKCEDILTEKRELLIMVAEHLIATESIEGEDFAYICEHGELPPVKEKKEEVIAEEVPEIAEEETFQAVMKKETVQMDEENKD